jgi:hypothetical protein
MNESLGYATTSSAGTQVVSAVPINASLCMGYM